MFLPFLHHIDQQIDVLELTFELPKLLICRQFLIKADLLDHNWMSSPPFPGWKQ